jgi:PAS domain S-box-containing protein
VSWVTVIWSIAAAVCFTLAMMHFGVWFYRRTAWANLAFAVVAFAVVGINLAEFLIMRARTPEGIAVAMRWMDVAMLVLTAVFLVMNFELSRDMFRAAQLSEDLRESEERLNLAADSAGFGVWTWFVDSNKVWASPLWRRLFGFAPDEAVTREKTLLRIHPDDRERVDRATRRAMETGTDYVEEYRVCLPDGTQRWISAHGRMFPNQNDSPARLMGASVDITERKRAEEALREKELQLSSIYNTVENVIFHLEVEAEGQYRFVSINESFCRVTGLSREQVVGKAVTDVIREPSLTMVLGKYRQAIEEKAIVRWEEVSDYPTGRLIGEVSVAPVFDDKGKCTHLVGSVHDITERKRAEEALKESEEMLRSIFVSTPNSITVVDLNGRIKLCNQATADIHGFSSAEQLNGKNVYELIAEEDRQRAEEVAKYVVIHDVAKDVPFVGLKASSEKFAGEISFSLLKDSAGRPTGFVGISSNITERKEAEEKLRASEIKYRNLVEITDTGYLILDLQGRVLDANQEYVRMSGHGELGEIIGRSVIEWTAEKAKQRNAEAVAQCWKDGFIRNFVTEYMDGSGNSTFVEVNAKVEGESASARILSLCRDVTQRMASADALLESEERLSLATEIADIGLWVWEPASSQIWASDRGFRMFGLAPGETTHFPAVMQRIHPDDRVRVESGLVHAAKTMGAWWSEYRVPRPDGTQQWIVAQSQMYPGTFGKPAQMLGVTIDITARKVAEYELERQHNELTHLSRVSLLGELTGSIAHELNQPLAAILSNAQAAQRFIAHDRVDINELQEILADIVAEDRRAGEVIRRLRALFQKSKVPHQPQNINEITQEVLRLVNNDLMNRGITAQTEFAPDLPLLHCDRVQIQQVLLNLVRNACDAMADVAPHGGQLTIRTNLAGDGSVRLSVTDCGTGIPPEELEHVFEPFYTTKPQGLGLGLAVCRTIMRAHGGNLWAANNQGQGTTFHFMLPATGGEQGKSQSGGSASTVAG